MSHAYKFKHVQKWRQWNIKKNEENLFRKPKGILWTHKSDNIKLVKVILNKRSSKFYLF